MKKLFTVIWEILEELGQERALRHMRSYGLWDH